MKRTICIFLCLGLLIAACGCAGTPQTAASVPSTAENTEPLPTTPALSDEEILAQRRDLVEAEMRRMMSVLWRSDTDIVYSNLGSSYGVEYDMQTNPDRITRIVAGRIYSGLPYSHGCSSTDSFLSYSAGPDESGIYNISGLTATSLTGNNEFGGGLHDRARISNNCADAVFWAWAKVSNSITFLGTSSMTEGAGCLAVGDYVRDKSFRFKYDRTKDITGINGEEVMYASYAQLQKADAIVKFNGQGHAMMISSVHVEENDGGIDPNASYVTVHEQFTGWLNSEETYFDPQLQQQVYRCGGVDRKYSFHTIFTQGYLPVTCKELIDPSPLEAVVVKDSEETHDLSNITKGSLSANYRIGSVTITIYDSTGKAVQQSTCYALEAEMYLFQLKRFNDPSEQAVLKGQLALDALAPGTYRCVLTCQVSTGEQIAVRDFTFNK